MPRAIVETSSVPDAPTTSETPSDRSPNHRVSDARNNELDAQIEAWEATQKIKERLDSPAERVNEQADRASKTIDMTEVASKINASTPEEPVQEMAASRPAKVSFNLPKNLNFVSLSGAPESVAGSPSAEKQSSSNKAKNRNLGDALSRATDMSEQVAARLRGWEAAYNKGGKTALGKQLLREVAVIAIDAAIKSSDKDIQTLGKVAKFLMPHFDGSRANKKDIKNSKAEAENRQRGRHTKHEAANATSNSSEVDNTPHDHEASGPEASSTNGGANSYEGGHDSGGALDDATTESLASRMEQAQETAADRARNGNRRKATRRERIARNFKERLQRGKNWAFSTKVGRAASATAAAYRAGQASWRATRK